MPRTVILFVLVASFLAACGGGSGLRAGDEVTPGVAFLGGREVSFRAERDHIVVGPRAGRFSAIRIEVPDASMEMYDIRVTFGDGSSFSPDTRLQFRAGESTRRIDLPGGTRIIREITFLYRSDRPGEGRAHVRVYGLR